MWKTCLNHSNHVTILNRKSYNQLKTSDNSWQAIQIIFLSLKFVLIWTKCRFKLFLFCTYFLPSKKIFVHLIAPTFIDTAVFTKSNAHTHYTICMRLYWISPFSLHVILWIFCFYWTPCIFSGYLLTGKHIYISTFYVCIRIIVFFLKR